MDVQFGIIMQHLMKAFWPALFVSITNTEKKS